LDEKNEWRRERSHEREPIGRANDEINQRDGPGQENEDLEKVRQGTTPEVVAANGQESGLKKKPETDRKEIKPAVKREAGPSGKDRPQKRRQKTERGSDEKLAIHREQPL
jgi:hypothetical protein